MLATVPVLAQHTHRYDKLLKQLNDITSHSTKADWAYEDNFTIEQPYQVDDKGMLSVVLKYTTDSSFYLVKRQAPVDSISEAVLDVYLILKFDSDIVETGNSGPNSKNIVMGEEKSKYLHIGMLANNKSEKELALLQKNLAALKTRR